VLVSTDKAAMPVNLYGSTKLCAEKLMTAANSYGGGNTRFSVVRYGNVVGSRGSIVETLIKNRDAKVVHVTDERMTRFWINLEQAFDIVLFALTHMDGGEIFIPKAPSMKLTDLFDIIVPEAKRNIIGIRPGEKLHEVLLTREEARHAVDFGDYYVVLPEKHPHLHDSTRGQKFMKPGSALGDDFHFSSETNEKQMSKEQLLTIVKNIEKLITG
jgi:UDP-N-acetylglucosamine 4,6-dehydratase